MGTHPTRRSGLLCLSLISTGDSSPHQTRRKKCCGLRIAATLRSLHLASAADAAHNARTRGRGLSDLEPPTIWMADAIAVEHATHELCRILSRLASAIAREPMLCFYVRLHRTFGTSERLCDILPRHIGSGRSRMLRHSLSLAWCSRCSMACHLA